MNLQNGITKNVTITGYERSTGTSDKCVKENNPDGKYDICKFWYAEQTNIDKPKYTAHGNIGRYFTLTGADADELIGELERGKYNLRANIRGYIGRTGELRVTDIATDTK